MTSKEANETGKSSEYHAIDVKDNKETSFTDNEQGSEAQEDDVDDVVIKSLPVEGDNEAGEVYTQTEGNVFTEAIEQIETAFNSFYNQNRKCIIRLFYILLAVLFYVYLIFVLAKYFERSYYLLILTLIVNVVWFLRYIKRRYGSFIYDAFAKKPIDFCTVNWQWYRWLVYASLLLILIIFAGVTRVFHDVYAEPERLISAFGIFVMLTFSVFCSKYPSKIQWRTVIWGIYLQVLIGLVILRTMPGYIMFQWLGDQVQTFLDYTYAGAEFVFDKNLEERYFVFVVLPMIIFTSAVISVLYYYGVMQAVISAFAWVMQHTMGTSGAESFATAANVFVGMTTAPLAIKPYLPLMTRSELHTIIVSGMATIAGSVLGVYIGFGASASHLLSASIMSAPAALACAKIFYPEVERPKSIAQIQLIGEKREEQNVLEALYGGAKDGLKICGYVLANLVAIISVLAFVNAVLHELGYMAGVENLSFELICSYLLYPIAWLLGTERKDCRIVAELIGTKTFLNEFVAYQNLGAYLDQGALSIRSQVIATYALCGFSNLGSLGVMLGGLVPLVPERKSEIATSCLRGLFAATIACLLTAAIAGLLYDGIAIEDEIQNALNTTEEVISTTLI
ncbi:solute carrier family 28 member 3-like [Antedon mediterranea]|uniref:solute carrier family 28 member 3-like n=1 Tax=Antedon mediterranea TaxID=105859 RepID=UPI003AF41EB5